MTLYLIDGHALAYRSYFAFARNPLVTSRGEETSAVYGFASTLVNILKKYTPTYLAAVFDSPEKTFRHDIYSDYKANREEMPESLIGQMSRIFSLLEAMSIPVYAVAGYEADDILATFTTELEDEMPVRIISGDKDLFQLISEQTHVIRPGKGGLLEDEIDTLRLQEQMGLQPG